MDFAKGGAIAVFLAVYLLPGLLGTVVYDYLVEGEKRDNFERLLHAFVLTLLSVFIVHGAFGVALLPAADVGNDTPVTKVLDVMLDRSLLFTSSCSVAIAVLFAVLNNHGLLYKFCKLLKLTHKVSSVDVWQDTFNRQAGQWIRVAFSDGRTLIGWPEYHSVTGKPRELFVADATWWEADADGKLQATDVVGTGVYVHDFTKVITIELVNGEETANG